MGELLLVTGALMAAPACSDGFDDDDASPSPPQCPGVAKTIGATISVGGDGSFTITLRAPTAPGAAFADPAQATSGDPETKITNVTLDGGVLTIVYDANVDSSPTFAVAVTCDGHGGQVAVYVQAPTTPGVGPQVYVTDD